MQDLIAKAAPDWWFLAGENRCLWGIDSWGREGPKNWKLNPFKPNSLSAAFSLLSKGISLLRSVLSIRVFYWNSNFELAVAREMGEEWAATFPSLGRVSAFPKLLSAVGRRNGAQVLAESSPNMRCPGLWRLCPEAISSVICSIANRPFQVPSEQEYMDPLTSPQRSSALALSCGESCRRRNARARTLWLCMAAPTAALLPVGETFTHTSGIWAQCEQPCKVNTSTYNFYLPKSLL